MWSGISSLGRATRPSGKSGKSRTRATTTQSKLHSVSHTMSTALVWFRRDLRVHDHPPLRAALDACERVIPVFVLDDRLLGQSSNRDHFLFACLHDLREALKQRGGDLVIVRGRPERALPKLARAHGAHAVYFASDVSPFAMRRDREVEAALAEA